MVINVADKPKISKLEMLAKLASLPALSGNACHGFGAKEGPPAYSMSRSLRAHKPKLDTLPKERMIPVLSITIGLAGLVGREKISIPQAQKIIRAVHEIGAKILGNKETLHDQVAIGEKGLKAIMESVLGENAGEIHNEFLRALPR